MATDRIKSKARQVKDLAQYRNAGGPKEWAYVRQLAMLEAMRAMPYQSKHECRVDRRAGLKALRAAGATRHEIERHKAATWGILDAMEVT